MFEAAIFPISQASGSFRQNVNKTIIALLMKTDHFACLGKWFLWQFRVNFMEKKSKDDKKNEPKEISVLFFSPVHYRESIFKEKH